ncbi:MAG TPA: RNA polymerase sigma factor [Polyangia bacterium]|jgi:RNA polymerase sigma-70 factor (ECF subfamily)|nr:RNA polymerase sigma factor [Polyangia bacterium]
MSVVAHSVPGPGGPATGQSDLTDLGFRRGLRVRPDQRSDPSRVDEHQFMWLLVRNLPELRGYARRLTGKVAEANDLVQETCRRAIESRSRFTSGSDIRAWLCCILRNYHCDRLRRLSREMLVGDHDGQFATPAPEPCASWAMVSDDDLEQALASLQPQYRSAYVLHAIDGRSYGQIAQALGLPSSTVGTRILRARHLLRVFLLARLEQRGASGSGGCRTPVVRNRPSVPSNPGPARAEAPPAPPPGR